MTSPTPEQAPARCATVGIVGRTNGGKSTLLNQLVGEKVSIVSPVVQTTRNTIRAILDEPRGQLVFVDTPGLHKAESKLGTLINRMARHAAAGVDQLVLVIDASEPPRLEDDGWFRRLCKEEQPQPCVVFLNKADRREFHAEEYRALWEAIRAELRPDREVLFLQGSAATGDGVPALVDTLFRRAEPGERLYDPDILSDYPRRLAIADVVREKLFLTLRDELPHEVGVRVDKFDDSGDKWRVEITLLVARASQKPIVIGPRGENVRNVRLHAQKELKEQYDVPFELSLWVKVDPHWMTDNRTLRQMGYLGEV